MKRLTLVSLLVSSVLLAGMGNNMPSFSDFDSDKNGKVTQKEFKNAQQKRMIKQAEAGKMMKNAGNAPSFYDIDSDANGYINKNEFQIHQQNRIQNNSKQRGNMGNGMGQGKSR